MNTYEIDEAREKWRRHPFLGPATATLVSLRDAADANSDGWAYWAKPSNAANKLIQLIESADDLRRVVTPAQLRAAYGPLKAFRTKSGLKFDIVEVDDLGAPLIFVAGKTE